MYISFPHFYGRVPNDGKLRKFYSTLQPNQEMDESYFDVDVRKLVQYVKRFQVNFELTTKSLISDVLDSGLLRLMGRL